MLRSCGVAPDVGATYIPRGGMVQDPSITTTSVWSCGTGCLPVTQAIRVTALGVCMSVVAIGDEGSENGALRQRLLGMVDSAIAAQRQLVGKQIVRVRRSRPDATPAEVIQRLERMYLAALTGQGAAVGAAAAAPGVGTGAALALSGGEVLSSLELSALHALALAEIHDVRIEELERRRTLVMGVMLGGSGSATIRKISERTGQHWARQSVAKVPAETLRQINKVLGTHLITKYGTKQGTIVLSQIAPFGFGAVIGGGANAILARIVITSARRAFGPAPQEWATEARS
jgi:hypothetical protein